MWRNNNPLLLSKCDKMFVIIFDKRLVRLNANPDLNHFRRKGFSARSYQTNLDLQVALVNIFRNLLLRRIQNRIMFYRVRLLRNSVEQLSPDVGRNMRFPLRDNVQIFRRRRKGENEAKRSVPERQKCAWF